MTEFRVVQEVGDYSLLGVTPKTGRTHQIRIHLTSIGHPIVGENKYIFRKDYDLRFKRTALHAAEIAFKHPVTGKPVKVEAKLSADMLNFLERNRR